jgi:hypothetical protein
MTTYYIGSNRGALENPQGIVAGTSTNSTDMELAIVMTNSPTRKDVIKFLRNVELYILGNGLEDGATGTYLPPL